MVLGGIMFFDLLVGPLSYCIASYDSMNRTRKTNFAKKEKWTLRFNEVVRGCKETPILWALFFFVLLLGMIVMRRCDSSWANLLTVLIKGNSLSLSKDWLDCCKKIAAYREGSQDSLDHRWQMHVHECFWLRSGLVNNSTTHLRFCKGYPKNNQGCSALTSKSGEQISSYKDCTSF